MYHPIFTGSPDSKQIIAFDRFQVPGIVTYDGSLFSPQNDPFIHVRQTELRRSPLLLGIKK